MQRGTEVSEKHTAHSHSEHAGWQEHNSLQTVMYGAQF